MRLASMMRILRHTFPESVCGETFQRGIWKGLVSIWNSLTIGGSDCLLFFDFMCLPQIGLAADGEPIDRTDEEKQVFFEALPSMGALYTHYPVLVSLETPPDMD